MEINIDVNSNKMVIKNEGNEFVINLGGETSSEATSATDTSVVKPNEVAGLNVTEDKGTKVTMGNEVFVDTSKETKVIKSSNDTKASLADYVVDNEGSGNYPDESIVEDVLNLYYNTNKTGAQITEELGISNMDLYRYLDDYGQGPNRIVRAKKSEVKPKIIKMAKSGKYNTISKIAKEVGVTQQTASRYLKEEGLSVNSKRTRKRGKLTKGVHAEFKKKYMPLVIAEYENNPMQTQAEIADTIGVSPATVGRYIKEYLDNKSAKRTHAPRVNKQALLAEANRNLSNLKREGRIGYEVVSGYDLESIKKKYNLVGSTPREVLANLNTFDQETIDEASGTVANINEMYPKVIDLYNSTNLGITEIAKELGLYNYTVCLYITKYEDEKVTA